MADIELVIKIDDEYLEDIKERVKDGDIDYEPWVAIANGVPLAHFEREVLDKIRAEIMQLDYDIDSIDYDYNDMTYTEEVHTIHREEVLQILDKYKKESEVGNE